MLLELGSSGDGEEQLDMAYVLELDLKRLGDGFSWAQKRF